MQDPDGSCTPLNDHWNPAIPPTSAWLRVHHIHNYRVQVKDFLCILTCVSASIVFTHGATCQQARRDLLFNVRRWCYDVLFKQTTKICQGYDVLLKQTTKTCQGYDFLLIQTMKTYKGYDDLLIHTTNHACWGYEDLLIQTTQTYSDHGDLLKLRTWTWWGYDDLLIQTTWSSWGYDDLLKYTTWSYANLFKQVQLERLRS